METHSQASSAAEKKKRVETIVATKGSLARNDISEKAVASSTTSNGTRLLLTARRGSCKCRFGLLEFTQF